MCYYSLLETSYSEAHMLFSKLFKQSELTEDLAIVITLLQI